MPPKKQSIQIVDVVEKDAKKDDDYAVTMDEIKESQLPDKHEPSETTKEVGTTDEKNI